MSMQQMLLGTAPGGLDVADLFSTDLYTGNASTKTITNGVDLSSGNNMVWIYKRNGGAGHVLTDSVRGVTKSIGSDSDGTEVTTSNRITSFNSNGFSLGSNGFVNSNGDPMAAWTFKGAEGFFDCVTWTGNGPAGRTISHNLNAVPGFIWVKELSVGDSWACYHPGIGNTGAVFLNSNSTLTVNQGYWNNTSPTSSVFTVGSDNQVNGSGRSYLAYLFAADTEDLIKCDEYIGNGGTQTINCGFQPQFVLIRALAAGSYDWVLFDSARTGSKYVRPNNTYAESNHAGFAFASNGFTLSNSVGTTNGSGKGYAYMAIAAA